MSVLARMRKPSPYNYYTNAIKLRKSMRFLLLRDLGIKDKVREVHEFAKDMSEDDRVEFILLASKYGVEQFKTDYHAYHTLCRLDSEERKLKKWIRNTRSTQMA